MRLSIVALVVSLAVLAVGIGIVVVDRFDDPPPPLATTPPPEDAATLGDYVPASVQQERVLDLTEEEAADAIESVESDSTVIGLAAGTQFEIIRIGPWTSGGEKIGASLELGFHALIDAPGMEWPRVEVREVENGRAVYQRKTVSLPPMSVQVVMALVDINTWEVVSLLPLGSELGGTPPPPSDAPP